MTVSLKPLGCTRNHVCEWETFFFINPELLHE